MGPRSSVIFEFEPREGMEPRAALQRLWDGRWKDTGMGPVILATPGGFRWLKMSLEFADCLETPAVTVDVVPLSADRPPANVLQWCGEGDGGI